MIYRGTATETILKLLLYKTLSYKDVDRLLKKNKQFKNTPISYVKNTLSRLKKKNLVTRTSSGWTTSNLAEAVLSKRSGFTKKYRLNNTSKDQIIVMYDIPEFLRTRRDQLRESLKILGFKQKQKSVWLGPSPLPKEFIDFLNEIGVIKYMNFFKAREEDVV